MTLTLRGGVPADAKPSGIICYEAFRHIAEEHGFEPDFPNPEAGIGVTTAMLANPAVYSVVAEQDGRVVGSNFLSEGGAIAGVGPITIDPACQNGGVGRALMEAVLDRARLRDFAGVRLVQAGYHRRSLALYAKLGFDVREPLATMQGSPLGLTVPGHAVRPTRTEDIEACNRLCARLHGYERGSEITAAIEAGTGTVVEHDGRITGYATIIGFFGHAIGETNADMMALIGTAPVFAGPGFLLPTRNADLFRWCLEQGLRVTQPMALMSMGLYNEPCGAFLPSILF